MGAGGDPLPVKSGERKLDDEQYYCKKICQFCCDKFHKYGLQ
jgi:hypothetical protein